MKKLLSLLLAGVLCVSLLAACGQAPAEEPAEAETAETAADDKAGDEATPPRMNPTEPKWEGGA